MKRVISAIFATFFLLNSCEEQRSGDYEVVVSETRPLTSLDENQRRNATAGERFYDQKPSPYLADIPDYWVPVPPGQFERAAYQLNGARLTVSQAGGDLLMNVNRWFGQFGKEKIDVNQLKNLPRIVLGGREAILVEATGTFAGRGGRERPGQALIGAMAQLESQLLVVKLTGPEEVVKAEKANFERFAKTLRDRPEENASPEGNDS